MSQVCNQRVFRFNGLCSAAVPLRLVLVGCISGGIIQTEPGLIEILTTIAAILVPMAVGYVVVRAGAFSDADINALGRYVLNIALPGLIFHTLTSRQLSEFFVPGYLLAFGIVSFSILAIGYVFSRRVFAMDSAQSTFQAMGSACSNSGFIGYPMLLVAMPALAPQVLALNFLVENLLVIPTILLLAERAAGKETSVFHQMSRAFVRVVRNPFVIAMVIGAAIAVSGIHVPRLLAEPARLIGASSAAVSLVVIGGTLARFSFRPVDTAMVFALVMKLLLKPAFFALLLLGFAASRVFEIDPGLIAAGVLVAGTPTAAIYPIFAQRYGQGSRASRTLFVQAVCSFLTMPLILALLPLITG